MLAKLELSIEKPDVLAKVKEFLKSLGNDIKVKEENISDLYSFLDTLYSEGIKRNVFLLIKNAE